MWHALLVLPAIAIGMLAAKAHGVAWVSFAPNLVGVGLGFACVAIARRRRPDVGENKAMAIAFVLATLLGITLLGPRSEGVARWVPLGPLRLHASSVVSPIVLWALSRVHGDGAWRALAIACIIHTIHCAQPDAGQATAFAIASCIVFARMPAAPMATRVAAVLVSLRGMAVAWRRPDPLAAVPHVERIVHLAFDVQPMVGVLAVAALAALVVPFRRYAPALAFYFASAILVSFVGAFPVPIMGAGAGPVLGWYVALALTTPTPTPRGGRFGVRKPARE